MNDFQEYFDMLMVPRKCRKYNRNAKHFYAARYPDRFCRFGTVKQTRVKRRPIVNENNAAAILAFAALNPHASSRQVVKRSGISQRSALRILHQRKFQPYRMSLHQDLYGNDFLNRVNFCDKIRRKMRTDVSFLSHVLFSYKANFANTGNANRHNMQNVLPQLMEYVPLHVCMNMWMQHDGALPHYALCSRQAMNGIFDENWIIRGGPVVLPPRSADLRSPDYFLWGSDEERIMAVALNTPDDMT